MVLPGGGHYSTTVWGEGWDTKISGRLLSFRGGGEGHLILE